MNIFEWFFSIFVDLYAELLQVASGLWLIIILLLVAAVILDQVKNLRSARDDQSARLNMPGNKEQI